MSTVYYNGPKRLLKSHLYLQTFNIIFVEEILTIEMHSSQGVDRIWLLYRSQGSQTKNSKCTVQAMLANIYCWLTHSQLSHSKSLVPDHNWHLAKCPVTSSSRQTLSPKVPKTTHLFHSLHPMMGGNLTIPKMASTNLCCGTIFLYTVKMCL